MKMKNTFYLFIIVTALCNILNAQPYSLKIDGRDGKVISISNENGQLKEDSSIVLYNKEQLKIIINNCDFINFDYEVKVKNEGKIVRYFNVVGTNDQIIGLDQSSSPDKNNIERSPEYIRFLEILTQKFNSCIGINTDRSKCVLEILSDIQFPEELFSSEYKLLSIIDSGNEKFNDPGSLIDDKGEKWDTMTINNLLHSLEDTYATYKLENYKVTRTLKYAKSFIEYRIEKADNELSKIVKKIDETIEDYNEKNTELVKKYSDIKQKLLRARYIMKSSKKPIMEYTFVSEAKSEAYSVEVKKIPNNKNIFSLIRETSDMGSESMETLGKQYTSVITNYKFETHSKSRFIFSMGLGYFGQPHSNQFSFVSKNDPGSDTLFLITESPKDVSTVRPYASLGMFLGEIDDLKPDEMSLDRIFVFIGSELNFVTTPKFIFGLSYDFPVGLNLGIGSFMYDSKQIAGGYQNQQEIGLTKKNTLVNVPTEDKTRFGYFVNFGMRPVIFELLFKLFKKP